MLDPFEDHCWQDVVPAETLEVYRVYRRATEVGSGPLALLAVDLFTGVFPDRLPSSMAEAVADNPRSCGSYAWHAMPVLTELLSLVRGQGHEVIYSSQKSPGAETSRATHRPRSGRDAADVAIHPAFAPAPGELVVGKDRASVFFGTTLAEHLRSGGVETLVLCGETTSGCVRATAVDAFSHGFHVVVVEDAVFDRSPLSHKLSLFDLHHKYADVMTLAELTAKLPAAGAAPTG